MHKTTAILMSSLLLLLFVLGTFNSSAQQLSRPKFRLSETDRLIKIQRLLRANSWLKQFSGVVIVAKNGEPLYKYTSGYAHFDYNIHNSLTGQYNLCEITQSFTALAILQLAEQNKIDLNTPISKYLSKLPKKVQDITPHQLLTHTAGIVDYYDLPEYIDNFLRIQNMDDLITIILHQPIQFKAGEKFQRSSSNYVLLAKLIEQTSGMPYPNYIKEKIIASANMERTDLFNWNEAIFNKAVGYSFDENFHPEASPEFWGAYPFGADAIYSDVEELLRFTEALKGTQLLGEKYKKLMFHPHQYDEKSEQQTAYGYGWKIRTFKDKEVIYQGGYIDNLSTQVRLYSDGFTIIVFSNYFIDVAKDIANKIENALYNDDYTVPRHPLAYHFYDLIEKDGIDKVIANFDDILHGTQRELDKVWTLNALARDFYQEGKHNIAGQLYVLNTQKFPNEPIVYESLGEYYYEQKNYAQSKVNYQKKLALLPNDVRATEMLRTIKMMEKNSTQAAIALKQSAETPNLSKAVLPSTTATAQNTPTPTPPPTFNQNTVIDNNDTALSFDLEPIEQTPPPKPSPQTPAAPKQTKAIKATPLPNLPNNPKIYTVVSKMPEFPGGQAAAFNYLKENLKYPPTAYQNNLEGTVHVSFVVNENGHLDNIHIKKSLTKGLASCDNEALRLVRQMPKWTPGIENGKPVKVLYTLPILFRKTEANRPAELDNVDGQN